MDSADAGLLVLRASLGLLVVAHGSQKLFGWFNGYGVRGTGGYFASISYPAGTLMAVLAGSVEAGGRVALAVGFLTPLVSFAFVALFVNVVWAGQGHTFRNHKQPYGIEYPVVLGVVSAIFALTGPGPIRLMPPWGRRLRPWLVRRGDPGWVRGGDPGAVAVSAGDHPVRRRGPGVRPSGIGPDRHGERQGIAGPRAHLAAVLDPDALRLFGPGQGRSSR
jgi:uncharacterized membrane protein YphA (DoxX/SURF4 family)